MSTGSTAPAEDSDLSDSQLFTMLGNDRRRDAIAYLATAGQTTVADVAEHIAASEGDDEGVYRSVYVSLLQNHLPKLAETGIVEYDADAGVVRRGPAFELAHHHLDAEEAAGGRPWLPVGLVLVGLLGAAAELAGLPPFDDSLDGVFVGAVFVALLVFFLLEDR